MEEKNLLQKWLDGTLTARELEEFRQTDDYRFVSRLDASLQHFKAPPYSPEEEEAKLSIDRSVELAPPGRRHFILKIAASLAFLLTAAALYFFYPKTDPVEISSAGKSDIYLPDSSFVSLNVQSAVSYDRQGWKKERKIRLAGEALFRVAKGSVFDVETGLGTVTVTGTVFNVKARGEYFEVTCFEGGVSVAYGDTAVSLGPNQGWRSIGGSVSAVEPVQVDTPDWLNNESRFDSVPYFLVLEEFERQYNVRIKAEHIEVARLFTGSFTHTDMELALKSITFPLNLTFTLEDDLVRLSGKR